jgi:hypothetical protein
MRARVVVVALAVCVLAIGNACSSSNNDAKPARDVKTPTTNAGEQPNAIPFDVGAQVSLVGGWMVQIEKVQRPYSNAQLPELEDGREYVAIDLSMANRGAKTRTVDTAALFQLGDSTGALNDLVEAPGAPDRLDGKYEPQTQRSGQLVFDVPTDAALRLAMNGPLIGTQQAIFMVDPPRVGPSD